MSEQRSGRERERRERERKRKRESKHLRVCEHGLASNEKLHVRFASVHPLALCLPSLSTQFVPVTSALQERQSHATLTRMLKSHPTTDININGQHIYTSFLICHFHGSGIVGAYRYWLTTIFCMVRQTHRVLLAFKDDG